MSLRKACAAEFLILSVRAEMIRPPVILLWGTNPKKEAKCFAEGNFVISAPTSEMICRMALARIPGREDKSTPSMRKRMSSKSAFVRMSFLPLLALLPLSGRISFFLAGNASVPV